MLVLSSDLMRTRHQPRTILPHGYHTRPRCPFIFVSNKGGADRLHELPGAITVNGWEDNFRPKRNSVYIYLQILSFFYKKNTFTFYLDWVMGENTLFRLGERSNTKITNNPLPHPLLSSQSGGRRHRWMVVTTCFS
jgi:hypothetical protein